MTDLSQLIDAATEAYLQWIAANDAFFAIVAAARAEIMEAETKVFGTAETEAKVHQHPDVVAALAKCQMLHFQFRLAEAETRKAAAKLECGLLDMLTRLASGK